MPFPPTSATAQLGGVARSSHAQFLRLNVTVVNIDNGFGAPASRPASIASDAITIHGFNRTFITQGRCAKRMAVARFRERKRARNEVPWIHIPRSQ